MTGLTSWIVQIILVMQSWRTCSLYKHTHIVYGKSSDDVFSRDFLAGLLRPQEIAEYLETVVLSRRAMLSNLVRDGLPALQIPSLDPVSVGQIPVNLNTDVVVLEGNISSVLVSGMSNLQLRDVQLQLPGMLVQLNIRVPQLLVTGTYFLDGSFSDLFPLKGSGPLTLILQDVDLQLVAQPRLYYDRVHVSRVDFTLAIANSSVKLVGFLEEAGFGELAQQFLEEMSGDFLRTAVSMFRENQFPLMVMKTNRLLRHFDWRTSLPNFVAIYLGFDSNLVGWPRGNHFETVVDPTLMQRVVWQFSNYFKQRSFTIPNLDLLTKKKFFKWTVSSGVRLLPGKLYGLDSLTTVGDTLISRHSHIFTFNLDVAAYNLKVVIPSQLIMLNKLSNFLTYARISRVKLNLQLELDGQFLSMKLVALHILHIGDIKIELSGLGALEHLAIPVAEYKLNLERSKKLLAQRASKIIGQSIAQIISGINLNSLLTNTINGQAYAVDPGIVFPDQVRNASRVSSLLSSVLGVEEGDGTSSGSGRLSSLFDILLGPENNSNADGNISSVDEVDDDILAAFGLSSEQFSNEEVEKNNEVDADILAAFGLTENEFNSNGKNLSEIASVRENAGFRGQSIENENSFFKKRDPDVLAAFGLETSSQTSESITSSLVSDLNFLDSKSARNLEKSNHTDSKKSSDKFRVEHHLFNASRRTKKSLNPPYIVHSEFSNSPT